VQAMLRRPPRIGLRPAPLLLLLLLPFCLTSVAVLGPRRSWVAIGRWGLSGPPCAARPRASRRSSLLDDDGTTAAAYLSSLGVSEGKLRSLESRNGRGFGEKHIKPFLRGLSELGFDDSQVDKMITKFSQIMAYSLEDNLKPKVQWLKKLGMDGTQVAKMIANYPNFLGRNLKTSFQPTVDTLRAHDFTDTQIVSILSRCPNLISFSSGRLAERISLLEASGFLSDSSLGTYMKLTDGVFKARLQVAQERQNTGKRIRSPNIATPKRAHRRSKA